MWFTVTRHIVLFCFKTEAVSCVMFFCRLDELQTKTVVASFNLVWLLLVARLVKTVNNTIQMIFSIHG